MASKRTSRPGTQRQPVKTGLAPTTAKVYSKSKRPFRIVISRGRSMKGKRFISYYRVSTARQGQSGLGIEAQRKAVSDYIASVGGVLAGSYTEVESGRRNDRPELEKALQACRKERATLVIAKLDRLARNARFLLAVVEGAGDGGVVFCDLPHIPPGAVGKFIVTQMAAVAELEAGLISQRTKAALAAARSRGVKLGRPKGADTSAAVAAIKEGARAHAENVRPIIEAIKAAGVTTLAGIAQALNARGIKSPRNGSWHPMSVARILANA